MSAAHARASGADESAATPFWISFADLMTALMMLFLLVMTVSLLALSRPSTGAPATRPGAAQAVADAAMARIESAALGMPGVRVDRARGVVDLGDQARFDTGSHALSSEAARRLRRTVVGLLAAVDRDGQTDGLARVVVEGFADPRGTYLMNLNLSLQRGQRVLCALLDPEGVADGIGPAERRRIRQLFSVGGFSFNAPRESHEASRRIELRMEFRDPREAPAAGRPEEASPVQELGECALGRAS